MLWPGNPPRDNAGEVIPHDDQPMVPNTSDLIRHVLKIHTTPDHNNGGRLRATSAAFRFSSTGSLSMSVDAWEPMNAAGLPPDHYAAQVQKGAARLPVAVVRQVPFLVGTEPLPGNPHHCGIWQRTPPLGSGKTDSAFRTFSRASDLVVVPP